MWRPAGELNAPLGPLTGFKGWRYGQGKREARREIDRSRGDDRGTEEWQVGREGKEGKQGGGGQEGRPKTRTQTPPVRSDDCSL